MQYAVSDNEPTSWTDADSAEIADGKFSFTAPSLQTDSSKLWVRLKYKYGSVYSTAVSADIHKYANPIYIVAGGCYIFVRGGRMMAYDPLSESMIMTDFSDIYENNYHYIQVVDFDEDTEEFKSYNTKKKGKLKVCSASEYIYYYNDSDAQSFKLTSDDSVATEFNFYTDWDPNPVGSELTVDLYVKNYQYLQAKDDDTKPSLGAIQDDVTYKWRLIPVPTPNAQ